MTYTVCDLNRVMRGCRICGEGPDEDGGPSCDCHIERIYCECCGDAVREDLALTFYKYNYEEVIHCESCLDYLVEEDEIWWAELAEEYFIIHDSIQENRTNDRKCFIGGAPP